MRTRAGWGWLVLHKENTQHFIGVGIFCGGSFLYSVSLVRLAATSEDGKEILHACLDGLLLLCAVVLVIFFVFLWFEEERDGRHTAMGEGEPQSAYIIEHAAYIAQVCFYALFFLYHSPDPDKDTKGYTIGASDYDDAGQHHHGVPMVCRPLIRGERALTIIAEEP